MMSQVEYLKKLPSESKLLESIDPRPEKSLIVYHRRLEGMPDVKKWLKNFPLTYSVKGGEELKDLTDFPSHLKKILKQASPFSPRGLCLVGVGGGTVGDFVGFTA